jgi:hypothetical protein
MSAIIKNFMGEYMKKALFGIFAVIVLLMASCDDRSLGMPVTYTVKYEITGTASKVNITMSDGDGNTKQYSNVSVPWTKTFSVKIEKNGYFFAYVSAQNQEGSGSISAKIYKNDVLFKSSSSNGAYVIATASGSIDY